MPPDLMTFHAWRYLIFLSGLESEIAIIHQIPRLSQSILALTLAKATAIVPGQVLTNEEMTGLVDGLFAVATPNYTPDGKTVLSVINEDDLEKLFK